MASRRALIVAPLYDGQWLPPLPGRTLLVERLGKCLKTFGDYDVKALDGLVEEDKFRVELKRFFDTDGELLFYFYGHGCLRPPGFGVFAVSSARPDKEGVLMAEVTAFANFSSAREVVLILDCCHAGASIAATNDAIRKATEQLVAGRDLLAGCASHQEGWTTINKDQKRLGAFSSYVLSGLEGEACPRGENKVRGGMLGNYVSEKFRLWGQSPFYQTNETGDKFCIITSALPVEVPTEAPFKSNAQIIGVPFKPSQLFIGRSAELDYLRSMLIDGKKPVAVSATVEGLGGIGKTELILQLLHEPEILSTYTTIIWLDGAGPLPPQWGKIAAELGVKRAPKPPDQLIRKVSAALHKRGSTLVVLDNAHDWHALSDFMPPEMPLLVTTRTRDFGGTIFRHTELGFLPVDSAKEFLVQMVPELATDSALDELVETLDGHALALELSGWNIKYLGLSAREYIERLKRNQKDSPQALAAIKQGRTVDACLSLTWDGLRLDASRVLWRNAALFAPTSAHKELLRVSFVGDEETRRELSWLASEEGPTLIFRHPEEFDDAYAELRACHVLSRVEGFNGERWAMHRLVRDFGRARLQSNEITAHAMAFSEWLRSPTLPLAPEIPHFVTAVLDSARYIGEFEGRRGLRGMHSEISYRSRVLDSDYFIEYFRNELRDPRALTMILSGLRDVNEDVRIQSIRLLENVGPIPEVLEGLAASLAAPETSIRERAASTLAHHGGKKTIEILLAAVCGSNAPSRLTAVRALGIMGKKAQKALLMALESADELVRNSAAVYLCEQGRKEGAPHVIELLQKGSLPLTNDSPYTGTLSDDVSPFTRSGVLTKDETVRAITALSNINIPEAYSLLFDLLKSGNDSVKCAAGKTIIKFEVPGGSARIVAELTSLPHKSVGKFRAFTQLALQTAADSKIPLPLELARVFMNLHDSSIVAACAKALGEARVKASVPLLIDALSPKNKDNSTLKHATPEIIGALRSIGHARASSILLSFANTSNDPPVKAALLAALIDFGEIDTLIKLLSADTSQTRKKAADTLGMLRAQQSIPALARALQDNDSRDARLAFVRALSFIGKAQGQAVLSKLIKTETDKTVRRAAIAGLIAIRSETIWKRESTMFRIFEVGLNTSDIDVREAAAASLIWINHNHSHRDRSCHDCSVRRIIEPKGKTADAGLEFARLMAVQRFEKSIEEKHRKLQTLLAKVEGALSDDDLLMFLSSFKATTTNHESYYAYIRCLLQFLTTYRLLIPIDSLTRVLREGGSLAQQSAAMALGILRKRKTVPSLVAASKCDSAATRWASIKALEAIGGPKARAHLTEIARTWSNDVERDAAKNALRRLANRLTC